MKANKKGISEVVVTILIVLVAIVAVVIVWAVLKPQFQSGAENVANAQDCFSLSLTIEGVTWDDNSGETTVTVKRNAGAAELSKIKVIVDGTAEEFNSESEDDNYAVGLPSELESRTWTLAKTSAEMPKKVEVGGVLKGDVVCTAADTATGDEITSTCVPDCGTAVCGDNGCGGSCGTCATGTTCTSGVCV